LHKSNHRSSAIIGYQHQRLIPGQPIAQELPGNDDVRLLPIELAVGVKERHESMEIIKRCSEG
jgi:hypothetical protein